MLLALYGKLGNNSGDSNCNMRMETGDKSQKE